MRIKYKLSERGLYHETVIENMSEHNMPNLLGYHTTFNLPFVSGSDSRDITILTDVGGEIERNMSVYLPTGKILPPDDIANKLNDGSFNPFETVISRHCAAEKPGRIEIADHTNKLKVVYKNDPKYGFRLIYNGNADEYICIEPMNCVVDFLNTDFEGDFNGFDYIAPGDKKKYISEIYIEEMNI